MLTKTSGTLSGERGELGDNVRIYITRVRIELKAVLALLFQNLSCNVNGAINNSTATGTILRENKLDNELRAAIHAYHFANEMHSTCIFHLSLDHHQNYPLIRSLKVFAYNSFY